MGERLTLEEHHTRAMLMGMKYNKWGGYYFGFGARDSGQLFIRLDALTLEPIGIDEANERQKLGQGRYQHD